MVFTESTYIQFLEHLKQNDPIMYEIVREKGYVKPPPRRNWFAILIGNIIGQKIRYTKARNVRGRLYTLLGTDNFKLEDFIKLKNNDLIQIGVEKWQIEILNRVVNFLSKSNSIYLSKSNDKNDLIKVKGIGKWTINNTNLMYSLQTSKDENIENIFLENDLIIKRSIKKLYGITKKSEYVNLIDVWNPYCGLVTWYLWKIFS